VNAIGGADIDAESVFDTSIGDDVGHKEISEYESY
jgi:hypothetical protein